MTTAFASIPEILADLRAGKAIVLVDDENRENEGDFVVAAEAMTVDMINFLTRVGGGYLCVAMDAADCERLDLGPQTGVNTSVRGTAFTVTVDGHPKHGVGTGISARDRAKSIQLLADPNTTVDDFVRPGHINPLRARPGGVLVRTGQTEGSVDLCRMAGLRPAAAIIEIVLENGDMARVPDLEVICARHGLKMCSVEQIIEHRLAREALVRRVAPEGGARIMTPEGEFTLLAFESAVDPLPHLVLSLGGVGVPDAHGVVAPVDEPVLVRMHRREILGDIFGVALGGHGKSSGDDLRAAMRAIQREGRGAIVYLRPEGSGEDFFARLQQIRRPGDDVNAPDLTRTEGVGARAVPMDSREFGVGGQILRELGLSRLRVLTNHPRPSMPGLHGFGLEIVEQVALRA
jgi:3,4-dihydroxy 2-butanone 4-phosphate synthase/GTP cyclohydrolase II